MEFSFVLNFIEYHYFTLKETPCEHSKTNYLFNRRNTFLQNFINVIKAVISVRLSLNLVYIGKIGVAKIKSF